MNRQQYGEQLNSEGIRLMTRADSIAHKMCSRSGCATKPRWKVDGKGFLCQKHLNEARSGAT